MTDAAPAGRALRADAERNRVRVLDAAAHCFATAGLDVSIDEIARRAGVGMGTIYRKFPAKEALITALAQRLVAQIVDAAARHLDDPEGLEKFLGDAGELFVRHRGILRKMWGQAMAPQLRQEYRTHTASLIEQAQQAGRISAQIEVADVTLVLWGLQGIVEQSPAATPEVWRRHLDVVLAGLRARTEPFVQRAFTPDELDAQN